VDEFALAVFVPDLSQLRSVHSMLRELAMELKSPVWPALLPLTLVLSNQDQESPTCRFPFIVSNLRQIGLRR